VSFWRGRRVLLTGHTGFKGSWLALWLLQRGATLTGLALEPDTSPALFEQLGLAGAFDSRIGDIRDAELVARTVREARPEVVLHLAAQPLVLASYEDPLGTFAANVMGTAHVLEALRRLDKPVTAVMVTTDKVYEDAGRRSRYREGDPLGGHDPYSASKAAAEIVIASYRRSFLAAANVKVASARAGNVIGGGDWAESRIVPDLVRAIHAGQPLAVRNPASTRPWQHVLEPLHGYMILAERLDDDASQADAFNFGPPEGSERSVRDLVELALELWPGDTPGWRAARDANARHEARELALAIDRARDRLGWRPRWDFRRTVEETTGWYHDGRGLDAASLRDLSLAAIARFEGNRP